MPSLDDALTCQSGAELLLAYTVKPTRLRRLAHTTHLRHLASVDSLTGCFNRRQFDADFITSHPSRRSFLLILDLDHFKRINDTYGHDTGDRVLVALALRDTVRTMNCVYHRDGEGCTVSPGTSRRP